VPDAKSDDLLSWSREELVAADIIHDEDHERNRRRLQELYGDVAARQNAFIAEHVRGSVLDVGAGYGTLVRDLCARGHQATGVEIDEEKIRRGREWYGVELRRADFAQLRGERFGTVVFREALNHMELDEALGHAFEIATDRCIVFQGTEIAPLRVAKKLYGHEEHDQKTPPQIVSGLERAGFVHVRQFFRDTLAFPLSGGWWGKSFVPNVTSVKRALLGSDAILTRAVVGLGLGPALCFRVLIVGEKPGR
jgi:SAM-dependent methyltransferase